MEIINHDSKLLKINQTNEFNDLFWAMKGGGNGNFGVIVSLSFKLIKAPKMVIKYDLHWNNYNNIYKVFNIWQKLAPHTDNRLTSQFTIFNNSFASQGLFIDGTENELKLLLNNLIESSRENMDQLNFKIYSYYDSILDYAQCKNEQDCLNEMKKQPSIENPILYKTKSSYAFKEIPKEGIDYFIETIPKLQLQSSSFICVQFDSYGGAIRENDINLVKSSFPHRLALYHAQYMIYYSNRNERYQVEQFINHLYDLTVPFLSPHSYVNYCDAYLKDYEFAYYSINMFKLRELKKKYDPFNLFKYEQSISFI
ncbi:predicted protein [Naegleria gruberi]|uniref:Predicted protein n=1 Tax=Naegleria gruberi TaxID=5762 RepID=D2VQR0_NAEGR|nr:uncharacterized protein NAEGRDRAFT_71314 [Naegleria gruberi]EFC40688.1 predicted protein [Naegleria gruberi]|eukprot:XP_002673432.1 predicted protein [Naegleria gruberi strain NEG-M]